VNSVNTHYKYTESETIAKPNAGITRFYKYIRTKIIIPQETKNSRISGTILLGFAITKDGSIDDIEIIKALGHSLDEEAIKTLRLTQNGSQELKRELYQDATTLYQ
jgi:TonB family protein